MSGAGGWGVAERTWSALVGVTTTEMRLAFTAALLAAAALGGFVLAPVVVRRVASLVRSRVEEEEVDERVPGDVDVLDVEWSAPTRALVRVVQTGVLASTALALLVVWGHTDLALVALAVFSAAVPYAVRLGITAALLGGAYAATRALEGWLDNYVEESAQFTRHHEGIVYRVLQVVVFGAVGLAALSVWEFDLGGLLVGAGFAGIVVGMAARQTLGSLIAGFVLMFSRPFTIGDWVVVDGQEGIVTDITIVNTHLRNMDGESVVLPNDGVNNSTVINRTARDRLRLSVDVGVDYDTDVERAEDVALTAIEDVDEVHSAPAPQVAPTAFGDSAVVLELRFWIDRPSARRKWMARAKVIRAVKAAFEREDITIPFPQRELSSREGGDHERVPERAPPVDRSTSQQ